MDRYQADVWRTQRMTVEFEVEDGTQDLRAVALEAARSEWFEAITEDELVENVILIETVE